MSPPSVEETKISCETQRHDINEYLHYHQECGEYAGRYAVSHGCAK